MTDDYGEGNPRSPPPGTFPVDKETITSRVVWGAIDLFVITSLLTLWMIAASWIVGQI